MPVKRTPIGSDFGNYLKALRVEKNITAKQLGKQLDLAEKTITNVENGWNNPPNPKRLKLWLSAIGCSDRYKEAMSFISAIKTRRVIYYQPRNLANEHIDRLIDSYDSGKLTVADIQMLRMIAPDQYS